MILNRYIKQPDEIKDYDISYVEWLPAGDTVVGAAATVVCTTDPADTALSIVSVYNTPTVVKTWLSGGTDGATYKVTVKATTSGGRVVESELLFKVKNT